MKSFMQTVVGAIMVGVAIFSPFLVAQSQSPAAPQAQVESKQPVLSDAQKLKMVELMRAMKDASEAASPERLGKDIGLLIAARQDARTQSEKALNDQYQMLLTPGWDLDIRSLDSSTWKYVQKK